MNKNIENTENAVVPTDYTQLENIDLFEIIDEDFDGADFIMERVKTSGSGATTFEVPGSDLSHPDSVTGFTAVILHTQSMQLYYSQKYTGATTPPDCASNDRTTGIGTPGGDCYTCPLNEFGSGDNNSKACKERKMLYLLLPGEVLPTKFSIATGSVKAFNLFQSRLAKRGKKLYGIVTRFSLEKTNNGGGISYSQVQFAVERELTADEVKSVKPYAAQVKEYCKQHTFDIASSSDYDYEIDLDTGEVVEPLNGEG